MTNETLTWYRRSTELPASAHEAVPPGRRALIDGGNAAFFSPLEAPFPRTYAVLLDAPPVAVAELAFDRVTGLGEEVRAHLYAWVIPLSDTRGLFVKIPAFDVGSPVRQRAQDKYLPHLPPGFAAFYVHGDGMQISGGFSLGGLDLPAAFAQWEPISRYYPERGLSEADPLSIMDDLDYSDDVRVVMTLRNGDFVLCDLQGRERALYVVRRHETGVAVRIDDLAVFDDYFSRCLRAPDDPDVALG